MAAPTTVNSLQFALIVVGSISTVCDANQWRSLGCRLIAGPPGNKHSYDRCFGRPSARGEGSLLVFSGSDCQVMWREDLHRYYRGRAGPLERSISGSFHSGCTEIYRIRGEQIPIIIFREFGLEVGIFQLFIDGADFMSWDSIPITLGPGSWWSDGLGCFLFL